MSEEEVDDQGELDENESADADPTNDGLGANLLEAVKNNPILLPDDFVRITMAHLLRPKLEPASPRTPRRLRG